MILAYLNGPVVNHKNFCKMETRKSEGEKRQYGVGGRERDGNVVPETRVRMMQGKGQEPINASGP